MSSFIQLLEESTLSQQLRTVVWLFPGIESLHLISLALTAGAAFVLDFAILGNILNPVTQPHTIRRLSRLALSGFILSFFTGIFLFLPQATSLVGNSSFILKLFLLSFAGLNALIFHRRFYAEPVSSHKIHGVISICLWIGVIFSGRWIAYAE